MNELFKTSHNTLCLVGYDIGVYIAPMPHVYPKKLLMWQWNICNSCHMFKKLQEHELNQGQNKKKKSQEM